MKLAPTIDLYAQRGNLRWVFIVMGLAIAVGSVWYSNHIVSQLKEREERQIDLYADVIIFTIQNQSATDLTLVTDEIIISNKSIPVILTGPDRAPQDNKNLDIPNALTEEERAAWLQKTMLEMEAQYEPIPISVQFDEEAEPLTVGYIYYKNSALLTQLKYFPYVQLGIIALFFTMAVVALGYSRRAEQNRLWVGLAKETAHQLGTPLSSLMAWTEYLKIDFPDIPAETITEIEKDTARLEMITERFSNIGSVPVLKPTALYELTNEAISYLSKRLSTRVKFRLKASNEALAAPINKPLFLWVIENLCKNAVDAMSGIGNISIEIKQDDDQRVIIDVVDDGKGMTKRQAAKVFQAGFTTKKRGWGLGLTLAKRIIENYHGGKIMVHKSEPDKGTTFRIMLKQQV